MADAPKAEPTKPDYGLDSPHLVKRMFGRAAWTIAVAGAVFGMNRTEYPGVSAEILAILGVIGLGFLATGAIMVWSSRVAKLQLRDRLLDGLALTGDEKILDVGCGRGLMVIGAAKRLKSGKATGIDVWNPSDLSGNSADSAKANAKLEGVADRVRIENCDPRKLPYPDGNYDVVLSALAIHNVAEEEDREHVLREMWRVTKPGGRVLIVDTHHTGAYAKVLRDAGARDVTVSSQGLLWCMPTRSLNARK